MLKPLALALLLCGIALAEDAKPNANSYRGKAPPELSAPAGDWINAKAPLTLAGLKGKVVYLQFGFLACPACKEMEPVLDRWDRQYAAKGLVVLAVDTGRRDALQALKDHAKDKAFRYPVLFDDKGKASADYGVVGFPAAFLLDASGEVVWEGYPVPAVDEIEKAIVTALKDVKPAAPKTPEVKERKPMAAKEPQTVTTPTGLKYQELALGSGDVAKAGDRVQVHYTDRKSTRLNSSHSAKSRMPSSA